MRRPNGYITQGGYFGFMPDGKWMLFAAQTEREEFFHGRFSDEEDAA